MLWQVLEIFRPGRAVVAMSVDMDVPCCPWSMSHLDIPTDYYVKGGVAQNFSGNGRTAFLSMGAHHCTPKVVDEADEPDSPRGVVSDEAGGFGGPFASSESSLAASMIESDGDSDADTAGIPPARLQVGFCVLRLCTCEYVCVCGGW